MRYINETVTPNEVVNVSTTHPMPTGASMFIVSKEITRSSTTTAYSSGQIVNASAASTLIEFDFSVAGCVANQEIMISTVTITDEKGDAATKLVPQFHLFNVSTLTGQNLADYQSFAPSYAELIAKQVVSFEENLWTTIAYGTSVYKLMVANEQRFCALDSSAKLYGALVATNGYTPGNGKKIKILMKGIKL